MARHCVGVLALQGAFKEHCTALEDCGARTVQIRRPHDLALIHGLIIPGGESTTMGKLLHEWKLFNPLQESGKGGLPIYGSCAGLILLCASIEGFPLQPRLGLLDASVQRNAFGRQKDSFESDISLSIFETPMHGVFIRAPVITRTGEAVKQLAHVGDRIVAVRQANILATSFHPELTDDRRMHEYFLKML